MAKNFAFLAGIYLYFVGWVYLYLYFRHFGVSLLGLEIPVSFFFVYAYPLVTTGLTALKVLLVLLIFVMVIVGTRRTHSTAIRRMMVVLTVALFLLSFEAAHESAEANAKSFRQGYGAKIVRLTIAPDAAGTLPPQFIEANSTGHLLLLLETKERLYFVYQPPATSRELPIASTYTIDRASLALADIDINNVSLRE